MYYGEAGDHFPGPNASNGSVATCFGHFLTFLVPIWRSVSLWHTHSVSLWNTHRAVRAGGGRSARNSNPTGFHPTPTHTQNC